MRRDQLSKGQLLAALALACLAFAAPARAAETPKSIEYVDGVPDTGQFLPNSEILARVGDRKISVFAFRNYYFLSRPEFRPGRDSVGRAEFLSNMVRKEVLGLTALSAGIPLTFEDRATLRETRSTLLSNRLFETNVLNTAPISEDSLRKVFDYYGYEQRLRLLHFTDVTKAEDARQALLKKTSTWAALSERYNPPALKQGGGELGWSKFESVPTEIALDLWKLKPGEVSPVLRSTAGYQVFQVLERRTRPRAEFRILKPAVEGLLKTYASDLKRREIMVEAKQGMNIRYDTTNVVWAARYFSEAVTVGREGAGQTIHIDENVPEFSSADTARTIATWDGGRISLGALLHAYSDLPAVMRPVISTPDRMTDYADALILAPRMVDLAVQRGLEKDPEFIRRYERKREEILVGKMVEDSCFTRITVSKQERKAFYEKNRNGFVTFPSIRYAVVVRHSKAGADSVLARLTKGERIGDVLLADSLAGNTSSGMKSATTNDHGAYEKVIFEEMRPGDSRVLGPDRDQNWACIHLLEFDPGRQLPYEEVEGIVDESVRNLKGETALNALVDRLKSRYPVEVHYEKLMSIKLTTPGEDEHE